MVVQISVTVVAKNLRKNRSDATSVDSNGNPMNQKTEYQPNMDKMTARQKTSRRLVLVRNGKASFWTAYRNLKDAIHASGIDEYDTPHPTGAEIANRMSKERRAQKASAKAA